MSKEKLGGRSLLFHTSASLGTLVPWDFPAYDVTFFCPAPQWVFKNFLTQQWLESNPLSFMLLWYINNKLLLHRGLGRNITDGAEQNNEKLRLVKALKRWGSVTSFLIFILISFATHHWSFFLQGLGFLKALEWLQCIYSIHSLFSLVRGFPKNPSCCSLIHNLFAYMPDKQKQIPPLPWRSFLDMSSISHFSVKLRQKALKSHNSLAVFSQVMFILLWSEFFPRGPHIFWNVVLKFDALLQLEEWKIIPQVYKSKYFLAFCKTDSFHSLGLWCSKCSRSFPAELLVGFFASSCNFFSYLFLPQYKM